MGRLIGLAVLLLPLIEIALFVLIGGAIGVWLTLLGVVLSALAGIILLRVLGLSLVGEIRASAVAGRLPARAMADTMMLAIAAILLILPGYFTDLVAVLLILPPVRTLLYALVAQRVTSHAVTVATTTRRSRQPSTIDLDEDDWRPRQP